jgi:hypothetical protein
MAGDMVANMGLNRARGECPLYCKSGLVPFPFDGNGTGLYVFALTHFLGAKPRSGPLHKKTLYTPAAAGGPVYRALPEKA